jgi:flagellar biosynthesis/type III secretory pathway M-ring protein FliF/YscJ
VVLLLMGAGAFFFLKTRKKKKAAMVAAIEASKTRELSAAEQMEAKLAGHAADLSRKEAEAIAALQLPEVQTKKTEVLTKHISAEIKKDPIGLAHVVRSWLNGEYQR